MHKIDRLRSVIEATCPRYVQAPESLLIYIESGAINARSGKSASHVISYTVTVACLDFDGDHFIHLSAALVRFVQTEYHEALQNPDLVRDLLSFEAEVINNRSMDVLVKVKLQESVIVDENGPRLIDEPSPSLVGADG